MTFNEITLEQSEHALLAFPTSNRIILCGGLVACFYGNRSRTDDIDAECHIDDVFPLRDHLLPFGIVADLTENISSLGRIALPPGYKERARLLERNIFYLSPSDFIISKLRRGLKKDMYDIEYCFDLVTASELEIAVNAAVKASPISTEQAVFLERSKNVLKEKKGG